jgi:hypothetical protein
LNAVDNFMLAAAAEKSTAKKVVGQFAIFRSAAVSAAARGKGKALEIFDTRSEVLCAAGEDTRAPIKVTHHRKDDITN